MPHVTVEYSSNLSQVDAPWLLYKINQTLVDLDLFQESDIKARAYKVDDFLIGLMDEEISHAFVAVKLELLSGRDSSVKTHLGQAVLRTLEQLDLGASSLTVQLTVQVLEIQTENYFKTYTPSN